MRPKLLDLFCGAGGAAMGYYRAGFDVVGVDIKPQPHYPFEFYQCDWEKGIRHQALYRNFNAIHASPPCQAYVQRNKNLQTKWPKLIEPVRDAIISLGSIPYVIENVPAAPLLSPVMLCGTMFSLPLLRHRMFESNKAITSCLHCNHWGTVASGDFAAVYAYGGKGHRHGRDAEGNKLRDPGSAKGPEWSVAMGIDWMTRAEMQEAIPPAYTEFIGVQLRKVIDANREASNSLPSARL